MRNRFPSAGHELLQEPADALNLKGQEMKSMKPFVPMLLILLASVAAAQEPTDQSAAEQMLFSKVSRVGEDKLRSFFMFSVSGREYTIRADGRAESASGKARQHNFNLKTDRGHVEQVYFFEHESDLLLLYELSDGLNGWGYAVRLSQTTYKPKWVMPISAFNLGTALVEGDYLYLTAASLVAKADLRSGSYVWRQENLHQKYPPSFQTFQAPWIKGDHVFFKEDLSPFKSIEVDKLTGKITNVLE